ncbi:MAG TPA: hypothetical protein VG184_08915 [Acidimicrobiales bacterium]|jgi:hypothetical protein|nr:hypothetical protein [Acidimicrobiales bacterium]
MAKHEFRFVVTDVELSEDDRDRVNQAIGQAVAFALADQTPPNAVSYQYRNILWRGIPPVELQHELEQVVEAKTSEE